MRTIASCVQTTQAAKEATTVENSEKIPTTVLKRLPIYLHFVKYMYPDNNDYVSSAIIAKALNLGEVQVRKDLQLVSGAGKPKVGYVRKELICHLEQALDVHAKVNAVLVGVGHLGKALLYSDGFSEYGIEIVGAFDVADKQLRDGRKALSPDVMPKFCREHDVTIGIITTPESQAQKVADELVDCGVKAIWNFAPTVLRVPDNVKVKNENLASSLAVLAVQCSK